MAYYIPHPCFEPRSDFLKKQLQSPKEELPEVWHCHPLSLDVLPEPLRCQAASKTFNRRRMAKVLWGHGPGLVATGRKLMHHRHSLVDVGHPEIAHDSCVWLLKNSTTRGWYFVKAFALSTLMEKTDDENLYDFIQYTHLSHCRCARFACGFAGQN